MNGTMGHALKYLLSNIYILGSTNVRDVKVILSSWFSLQNEEQHKATISGFPGDNATGYPGGVTTQLGRAG